MYNSTIKIKLKICRICGRFRRIFSKGRCHSCAIKEDGKKKYQTAKKQDINKVRSLGNNIDNRATEQQVWYIHRSKEMTGRCANCGSKSCKGDKKYWKFSIAHILPKSVFESVATHPLNFVELCYFDNSCHTNFDNNGYGYVKEKMPKLWSIIIIRVKAIYPSILEKDKIPDVLLNELL